MINETSLVDDAELDIVSGGMDPNYKFCWGTAAGGGAGLYPAGADCHVPTNAEVYKAFFDGFHRGGGTP